MNDRKTIKFGPEWLRNVGNNATTGSTSEESSNSNAASNAHKVHPSALSTRFPRAEFRYGREELLALFDLDLEAPPELRHSETLFVQKAQYPFALSDNNYLSDFPEDVVRSDNSLRSPAGGGGDRFLPSQRRTTSDSSFRGRFTGPGRGRSRITAEMGDIRPPVRSWNSVVPSSPGPQPISCSGGEEWKSQKKWNELSSWRRKTGNVAGNSSTSRTYFNSEENADLGASHTGSGWRNASEANPQGHYPTAGNTEKLRGPARIQGHKNWNNVADGHLPEWAVDTNVSANGSFDSSGAFHGSSDEYFTHRVPSDNAHGLTRSQTQTNFSTRKTSSDGHVEDWWDSEKARKLQPVKLPAVDFKSGLVIEPKFENSIQPEVSNASNKSDERKTADAEECDTAKPGTLNDMIREKTIHLTAIKNSDLHNQPNMEGSAVIYHHADVVQQRRHQPQQIQVLQKVKTSLSNPNIAASTRCPTAALQTEPTPAAVTGATAGSTLTTPLTQSHHNSVAMARENEKLPFANNDGPDIIMRADFISKHQKKPLLDMLGDLQLGEGETKLVVEKAVPEKLLIQKLEAVFPPYSAAELFPYGQPPPSEADTWFYEDPQGTTQGPFTHVEMAQWWCEGFFPSDLRVRRSNEFEMRPLWDYGLVPPFMIPPMPAIDSFDSDSQGENSPLPITERAPYIEQYCPSNQQGDEVMRITAPSEKSFILPTELNLMWGISSKESKIPWSTAAHVVPTNSHPVWNIAKTPMENITVQSNPSQKENIIQPNVDRKKDTLGVNTPTDILLQNNAECNIIVPNTAVTTTATDTSVTGVHNNHNTVNRLHTSKSHSTFLSAQADANKTDQPPRNNTVKVKEPAARSQGSNRSKAGASILKTKPKTKNDVSNKNRPKKVEFDIDAKFGFYRVNTDDEEENEIKKDVKSSIDSSGTEVSKETDYHRAPEYEEFGFRTVKSNSSKNENKRKVDIKPTFEPSGIVISHETSNSRRPVPVPVPEYEEKTRKGQGGPSVVSSSKNIPITPWSMDWGQPFANYLIGGFWDSPPVENSVSTNTHRPFSAPPTNITSVKASGATDVSKKSNTKGGASKQFEEWCMEMLKPWSTDIDVPTFINFLKDVESPFEVRDYVKCYLGDDKDSSEFSKQFLEKRSKVMRAPTVTNDDDLSHPAAALNPPSSQPSDTDAKGKNKKGKKKMQRIDSRILGFSVTASQDRINVGAIDKLL